MDNTKPLYPISVLSELLDVHQRTLRIYEQQKLLTPSRTPKNRRLYSQNDIEKAKLILYLTRNLAINLAGVEIIFGILEKLNIKPCLQMDFIKKLSIQNNINEQKNILKSKNKGRKLNSI